MEKVEVKHCGGCDRSLPVTNFRKRKASYDGLDTQCRECKTRWWNQNRKKGIVWNVCSICSRNKKDNTFLKDLGICADCIRKHRILLGQCAGCGGETGQYITCDNCKSRGDWGNRPPLTIVQRKCKDYQLSDEEYIEMKETQGGRCAICDQIPQGRQGLGIDHCHSTGKVRGLLCNRCNTAIGLFKDSPRSCAAAAEYLKRSTRKP